MRCFYHQDREAVGLCKSCARALCAECAVDQGTGLACRGRCEERARDLNELQDRAIKSLRPAVRIQTTASSPLVRSVAATPTKRVIANQKRSQPWWKFW